MNRLRAIIATLHSVLATASDQDIAAAVTKALETKRYPEDIRDEALKTLSADPEDWDLRTNVENEVERQRSQQLKIPVDRSDNGTVVTFAMHTLSKGKSPKAAAESTDQSFHESENMFVGPGVIHIDAKKLEEAIWGRLVDATISSMKSYRADKKYMALEGTLIQYKQRKPGKPAPKIEAELRQRIVSKLGHDPFVV